MATILYFAWVREKVGQGQESIPLPVDVDTVGALLAHLRQLDTAHADALASDHLRVAVNQKHATPEMRVTDSDEVAIFPPVSGG